MLPGTDVLLALQKIRERARTIDLAAIDAASAEIRNLRKRNEAADLLLSRVLHDLAGAASLCWDPKPTGVFYTEKALEFVEEAINELRAALRGLQPKE